MPFLVAGDPDLATTEKALRKLDALGADVIELGVPYSDPLADGRVIQVRHGGSWDPRAVGRARVGFFRTYPRTAGVVVSGAALRSLIKCQAGPGAPAGRLRWPERPLTRALPGGRVELLYQRLVMVSSPSSVGTGPVRAVSYKPLRSPPHRHTQRLHTYIYLNPP